MSAVTTSIPSTRSPDSGAPQARALPLRGAPALVYGFSIAIALLMTITAAAGLFFREVLYPTSGLKLSFLPSDAFNLVVGLPLLLLSMFLARRGSLTGLLSWPGVLFYVLYMYLPYAIGVPFNVLYLPYQLIVVLSSCAMIYMVASIDVEAVKRQLAGRVPARLSAGILLGLAALIGVRQTGLILGAIAGETPVDPLETLAWTADFMVAIPILLAVGSQLWRRKPFGYATAPGALLGYGLLALSLIPFFVSQAATTAAPFDLGGIVVVLFMSGLCFVPFASFIRAAGFSYRDLNATRIIAAAIGVIFGLSGINHGFFEFLQGDTPTGGLVIHAIGEAQRFWVLGTEDAFTILPNFHLSGLLSMLVGLAIVIWSLRYLHTKHGPTIFLILFLVLFLVGGGIGQLAFFIPAWAFATRMHKPLDWWRTVLPRRIRPLLSALWPLTLLLSTITILIGVEIAIFGYFPGISDPLQLQNAAMSFVLASAILNIFTFVSGLGHDLRRMPA